MVFFHLKEACSLGWFNNTCLALSECVQPLNRPVKCLIQTINCRETGQNQAFFRSWSLAPGDLTTKFPEHNVAIDFMEIILPGFTSHSSGPDQISNHSYPIRRLTSSVVTSFS